MRLSIQAICHKGLVRDNNEDALSIGGFFLRDDTSELTLTTPEEGFFYLLVSDGMGGHERGEEASEFTLEQIQERVLKMTSVRLWPIFPVRSMKGLMPMASSALWAARLPGLSGTTAKLIL